MFCPKCGKQNQDASKFCKNCGKALPVRQSVPTPQPLMYHAAATGNLLGQILDNKYRIESKLGSGGMGDVYKATRLLIGDSVAIKILHAHLANNTQAAERFRREAQTAIQLKHRNIVTLYDVGISSIYNIPYLLMELAEGLTLREVIRQNRILPLEFVVTVTAQICGALVEAHRLGIIHRDIKPENIVVNKTPTGWQIKILDFGIAKLYDQTDVGLTQDGNAMGTPQYMSPEQCMGEVLDGRSDLYSTAIVVYELLSGTVPFKSPSASAVAIQQVQSAPPPLRSINSNVPSQVEAVVMRGLEKKREMRQPSAAAFAQELIQAATTAMSAGLVLTEAAEESGSVREVKDLPETQDHSPDDKKKDEIASEQEISPQSRIPAEADAEKDESANQEHLQTSIEQNIETGSEEISEELPDNKNIFEETLIHVKTDQTHEAPATEISARAITDEVSIKIPAEVKEAEFFPVETPQSIAPARFEETAAVPLVHLADKSEGPERSSSLHEDEKSRPGIEVDLLRPPEKNRTLLIGVFAIAALVILSGAAGLVWILFLRDPGSSSAAAVITGSGPSNPQAQNEPPAGMVFVPAGEFTMGTDKSIDEIKQDTPAHKVTAGPFFIDLTEVTNEDYQKFVAASSHRPPPDWSGQNFPQGKAKFPVTGVDWDDAGAYAKWAEKRLPTEEEWEFAAHSDGKIYPWGDEWKNEYANANKQRSVMLEVGKTTGRSRLGLADMIGNAWEWTASDTRAYSGGKEFDDDSMTDPKVIRGGFWGSSKEKATATVRRAYGARNEKDGYSNTGFRCVKDAPQN